MLTCAQLSTSMFIALTVLKHKQTKQQYRQSLSCLSEQEKALSDSKLNFAKLS